LVLSGDGTALHYLSYPLKDSKTQAAVSQKEKKHKQKRKTERPNAVVTLQERKLQTKLICL